MIDAFLLADLFNWLLSAGLTDELLLIGLVNVLLLAVLLGFLDTPLALLVVWIMSLGSSILIALCCKLKLSCGIIDSVIVTEFI